MVILFAAFGLLLASYMLRIITGGVKHLVSNFRNSDFALVIPGKPEELDPTLAEANGAPREEGMSVMRILAWSACVVEASLIIVGILGVFDWFLLDVPGIEIRAAPASPTP